MSKSNKIEVRHPEAKTDTGAYSAGVIVDGWLYVSGQGPLDLESGTVLVQREMEFFRQAVSGWKGHLVSHHVLI